MKKRIQLWLMISVLVCTVFINGCGLLWFGAGAATGAAVTKDAEDGKVIDD
jgi:hypothetical protein